MLPKGRIDREALNETMEETRRASSFRSDSAFNDGAGIRSYKYDRVPILAKITDYDLATGRYSWTQVYSNFDGSYGISEDALDGNANYLPAYELATNPNVPLDTVVNLIPGDGEFFLFAYPTTVDFGSGSGSVCDDILIPELDIRCEDGELNLYRRAIILNLIDGCLTQDFSDWQFLRTEGCCECSGSGSGGDDDDDVDSGSGFYGSGGEMLISTACCPEGVPAILFADGSFYINKLDCTPDDAPFCTCDDFTVELTYGNYPSSFFSGDLNFWRGEQELSCGLTIQFELYCIDSEETEWKMGFILFDDEDPCSGSSALSSTLSFSGCDPFSATFILSDVSVLQNCFACVHPSNEVYLCVAVGE